MLDGADCTSEVKERVVKAPGAMPGIEVKLTNGEGVGGVAASSARSTQATKRNAQKAITMSDWTAFATTPA